MKLVVHAAIAAVLAVGCGGSAFTAAVTGDPAADSGGDDAGVSVADSGVVPDGGADAADETSELAPETGSTFADGGALDAGEASAPIEAGPLPEAGLGSACTNSWGCGGMPEGGFDPMSGYGYCCLQTNGLRLCTNTCTPGHVSCTSSTDVLQCEVGPDNGDAGTGCFVDGSALPYEAVGLGTCGG